jgi:alpha-N-arabinofuranosidase
VRSISGDVRQVAIDTPTYETAKFGAVPVVDAVATWDADGWPVLTTADEQQGAKR